MTTTTETALKECPCCASPPRLVEIPGSALGFVFIRCDGCGLCTPPCEGREEAVATWNRRGGRYE